MADMYIMTCMAIKKIAGVHTSFTLALKKTRASSRKSAKSELKSWCSVRFREPFHETPHLTGYYLVCGSFVMGDVGLCGKTHLLGGLGVCNLRLLVVASWAQGLLFGDGGLAFGGYSQGIPLCMKLL